MLRYSILIGLFILYGTILAEHVVPRDGLHHISRGAHHSRTRRFFFSALDELRRSFCHSSCTSADTMSYLMNAMCAIKCPELYLPHRTTTKSTTSSSTKVTSTTPSSTTSKITRNPIAITRNTIAITRVLIGMIRMHLVRTFLTRNFSQISGTTQKTTTLALPAASNISSTMRP